MARAIQRWVNQPYSFEAGISPSVSPILDIGELPTDLKGLSQQFLWSGFCVAAPGAGAQTSVNIGNTQFQADPFLAYIIQIDRILVTTDIAGIIRIGWGIIPAGSTGNFGMRDTRLVGAGLGTPPGVSFIASTGALLTRFLDRFQIGAGLAAPGVESIATPLIISPPDGTSNGVNWLTIQHETVTTPTLHVRVAGRVRVAEPTELGA